MCDKVETQSRTSFIDMYMWKMNIFNIFHNILQKIEKYIDGVRVKCYNIFIIVKEFNQYILFK